MFKLVIHGYSAQTGPSVRTTPPPVEGFPKPRLMAVVAYFNPFPKTYDSVRNSVVWFFAGPYFASRMPVNCQRASGGKKLR